MFKKPDILHIEDLAKTKHFCIQSLDLKFSNGKKRRYERLKSSSKGAVLVIPMLDNDTVLMIYEYCGGTDKYELALPKGKVDANETIIDAANREMMEEVGYGAKKLSLLKSVTLAPGYQSNKTHIILAQDLYPKTMDGDEPEPLVVVKHKLSKLDELLKNEDLTEARSILALYIVRDLLKNK